MTGTDLPGAAQFIPAAGAPHAGGAVVVVDVLRAFTTAAYAFAAGATRIWLVDTVEAALQFKAMHAGVLATGEDRGRRIAGFDFANSPAEIREADLTGREIVQRTSAGTRAVVAAAGAARRWCAGLVCASATAAAVRQSGLGVPTYVISGRFEDRRGDDDMATAQAIERARVGEPIRAADAATEVSSSREAAITLALGAGHVDPRDIELATRVDAFDFAMEARQHQGGLELRPTHPPAFPW